MDGVNACFFDVRIDRVVEAADAPVLTRSDVYPPCHARDGMGCSSGALIPTAIINGESRRPNTTSEYDRIGRSVGTIECKAHGTQTVGTAYVVATNVLRVAAHTPYRPVLDANGQRTGKLRRVFSLPNDCVIGLRDARSEHVARYRIEESTECAAVIPDEDYSRCDWAIVRTLDPLPPSAVPLKLWTARAQDLNGAPIIAVGHHAGVTLNSTTVLPKQRLVDVGRIRPKTPRSRLWSYPDLIQYTVDTNGVASGQPILIEVDDQLYVVASHKGEYRSAKREDAPFDEARHFNFGQLHLPAMLEAIRKYAPPSERDRYRPRPPVHPSTLWGLTPAEYEKSRAAAAASCKDLDGAAYFDCTSELMRAARK